MEHQMLRALRPFIHLAGIYLALTMWPTLCQALQHCWLPTLSELTV